MDSPEQERTSNRDLWAGLQKALFFCHSSEGVIGLQEPAVLEYAPQVRGPPLRASKTLLGPPLALWKLRAEPSALGEKCHSAALA